MDMLNIILSSEGKQFFSSVPFLQKNDHYITTKYSQLKYHTCETLIFYLQNIGSKM